MYAGRGRPVKNYYFWRSLPTFTRVGCVLPTKVRVEREKFDLNDEVRKLEHKVSMRVTSTERPYLLEQMDLQGSTGWRT